MCAIASQRLRFVPKWITRRNPLPHVPIQCIYQLWRVFSYFFINISFHDNRRGLDQLIGGYTFKPVGNDSRGATLKGRDKIPVPVLIHQDMPAESRPCAGLSLNSLA